MGLLDKMQYDKPFLQTEGRPKGPLTDKSTPDFPRFSEIPRWSQKCSKIVSKHFQTGREEREEQSGDKEVKVMRMHFLWNAQALKSNAHRGQPFSKGPLF